jgi:hypothetical protein
MKLRKRGDLLSASGRQGARKRAGRHSVDVAVFMPGSVRGGPSDILADLRRQRLDYLFRLAMAPFRMDAVGEPDKGPDKGIVEAPAGAIQTLVRCEGHGVRSFVAEDKPAIMMPLIFRGAVAGCRPSMLATLNLA